MLNMDFFINSIYNALTSDTTLQAYAPAVKVSKGPREINATTKTYSLQIQPMSLTEEAITTDGSFNHTFSLDIVGIICTNDIELLAGGTGRKSLQNFIEDTFNALNSIREISDESQAVARVDFSRADIDYQPWPNVAFTISVSVLYEHKY